MGIQPAASNPRQFTYALGFFGGEERGTPTLVIPLSHESPNAGGFDGDQADRALFRPGESERNGSPGGCFFIGVVSQCCLYTI